MHRVALNTAVCFNHAHMVEIEISYAGGLRCRAVHGPSGAVLETDAPVDNHGEGGNFSPTDLAATALGTCMLTLMAIAARRHGLELDGVRVKVLKEMSKDAPRRIARLAVEYHLPLPPEHPQRALLENAARTCPVHHSLHPEIEQDIRFLWNG